MQNSSPARITTYIVLLSAFVSLLQYLFCRFIGASYISVLLGAALLLAGSFFLVYKLQDYEGCFNFSLLCLLFQAAVAVTDYGNPRSALPDVSFLLLFCLLDWLVPMLLCFLLYLTDGASRYERFPVFFRSSTIVFSLAYLLFLGYVLFFDNPAYDGRPAGTASFSFLPFVTIAAQIENLINGSGTLSGVFLYLAKHTLPFLPYGFLITLALRKLPLLVRLPALLVLPVLTELIQYFFRLGCGDIDDAIFGFLGAFLGAFCFFLLDLLCRTVTGTAFLQKESRRNYYKTSIRY